MWQCNEIAALEKEFDFIQDLYTAFDGIERMGKVPDDERNRFTLSKAVRKIANKFMQEVPAAEREAKASQITNSLGSRRRIPEQTRNCREMIKKNLQAMRAAVESGNQNEISAALDKHRRDLATNGWFKQVGIQVFRGVFSLNLVAGGADEQRNVVIQEGPEGEQMIGLGDNDSISDVVIETNGIYLGVDDLASGEGRIDRIDADPATGVLNPDSLRTIASDPKFAGGIGLAIQPNTESLFVLARGSQDLFQIQNISGGSPSVSDALGNLDMGDAEPSGYLYFNPAGTSLCAVEDNDTLVNPSTHWKFVDLGDEGDQVLDVTHFQPFNVYGPGPTVMRMPVEGDDFIQVGGTPREPMRILNVSSGSPELIGESVCDAGGNAFVPIIRPLQGGDTVMVEDGHGRHSTLFPAVRLGPPNFSSPFVIQNADPRSIDVAIEYQSSPFSQVVIESGETLNTFPHSNPVSTDGFGVGRLVLPGLEGMSHFFRSVEMPAVVNFNQSSIGETLAPGITHKGNLLSATPVGVSVEDGCRVSIMDPPAELTLTDNSELFQVDERGNFCITPTMPMSSVSFEWNIVDSMGNVKQGPFNFGSEVSVDNLTKLVSKDGVNMEVPCLVLNGEHFPMVQFRLVWNLADLVKVPHWHWYPEFPVASFESPAVLTPDPDQPREGYGLFADVSVVSYKVPLSEYRSFAVAYNQRIGN